MKISLSTIYSIFFYLIKTSYADEDAPVKQIVGGTEAEVGSYPFQVAVLYNGFQGCGGSLIAEDWVLTAGHCCGSDSVSIGRHNIAALDEDGAETIEVDYEIVHPRYNGFTLNNDISLLKLTRPSAFSPITWDDGSQDTSDGAPVTVIGWGTTSSGGPVSDVLLEVEVNIVENSQCNSDYGLTTRVTDVMMCAASPGKDACQGDSGGPLFVKGTNSTSDVQVGIVSWGFGCADPNYPGVYARVSEFDEWIRDTMSSDSRRLHVLKQRSLHKFRKMIAKHVH